MRNTCLAYICKANIQTFAYAHTHTYLHTYNLCLCCLSYKNQVPLLVAFTTSLHFKAPAFLPRLFQLSIAFLEKCDLSLYPLQWPQKYFLRSIRPSPGRHVLHANSCRLCSWFRNTTLSNPSWVVDNLIF